MTDWIAIAVTLAVLAVTVWTTLVAYDKTTSGFERAQSWCEDRNGTLQVSNTVAHNNLHCDLPNGTTVHVPPQVATEDTG